MAIDRTNITPIDDDGTETTGTVLDAAFFDAIYDAIDAYVATLPPSAEVPFFNMIGPTQLRDFTFPDANATVFTSEGIANDALKIFDTDDSHYLFIVPGSNLSADRTFTLVTGNSDRTLTLSGNPTLGDWFDQAVKAASSPTFAAITIGSTAISETDIAKIDGITNGTAAASKALVLDANKDVAGIRHLTLSDASVVTFGALAAFASPANGHFSFLNNAQSSGFRVKISSDGVAAFRLRDDSADAAITTGNITVVAGGKVSTASGALKIDGASETSLDVAGATKWFVQSSGHLLANGAFNIGDGAGNSPSNVYAESAFIAASAAKFTWDSRSQITSPSDGVVTYMNAAGTGFTMQQYGGTTSSFPAWKRVSATIRARLADDSGDADVYAAAIEASGTIGTSANLRASAGGAIYWQGRSEMYSGSGSPEGSKTAPVGSIYLRTDGGAGTSFYVKESGSGNTGWVAK